MDYKNWALHLFYFVNVLHFQINGSVTQVHLQIFSPTL